MEYTEVNTVESRLSDVNRNDRWMVSGIFFMISLSFLFLFICTCDPGSSCAFYFQPQPQPQISTYISPTVAIPVLLPHW